MSARPASFHALLFVLTLLACSEDSSRQVADGGNPLGDQGGSLDGTPLYSQDGAPPDAFVPPKLDGGAVTNPLVQQALDGLKLAATYFCNTVASHGGYVWLYTPDLSQRWGEGVATQDQIWVQPPGTPLIGLAYVEAYEATGDPFYRDCALQTGQALLYGQLTSGGWTHFIDFDLNGDKVAEYRNGQGHGKNNSTFDDGSTQTSLRFLARLDKILGFSDASVKDGIACATSAVEQAQYPNGGFPQVWTGPVPDKPVLPAGYPPSWCDKPDHTTGCSIKEYWTLYTLNDNLAGDVTRMLIAMHRIYQGTRYRDMLAKLGDFLILAQMPDPQPGWAQQYDFEMHPTWARKFEPPAITGWESQDVMEALLMIYEVTGDSKYLQPLPAALSYYGSSLLADGRLARFYELQTNTPLYLDTSYNLTYSDADLPGHYGFKMPSRLAEIESIYNTLKTSGPTPGKSLIYDPPQGSLVELEARVKQILADLDPMGRWVEVNTKPIYYWAKQGDYIQSQTFYDNVLILSQYITRAR